ncbi:MAG: LptF/LptG family permease [Crocinitomicaceae bacterium]|tara:strand:- start:4133 stop:5209 length:1077 start_codon:yes stop_codon:yes gene_type:complete
MLSIIDRYIIKKFLSTFFFMLGVIMMFAIVFDVSEKLGEFISNKAPLNEIVLDYYVNFIILYGNMFTSMIVFLSVIWFTTIMAKDTEIIPIWFSGKPMSRYLRPYFIAASILMVFSLAINHIMVPRANKVRLAFEEKYYRDVMVVQDYHAEFPENESVYFSNYTNSDGRVNDFTFQKWSQAMKPIYFLKARYALNEPNSKKWILNDLYEKRFFKDSIAIRHIKTLDTSFNFSISDMAQRENTAETMTYSELNDFISREQAKGSSMVPIYQIELHQRTSYPFAAYILTLIGVSVASKKRRGGVGINIAIGLGIVFVYIFSMKMLTVASLNIGFPPLLSVWTPNIFFAFTALILFRFSQK